MDLGLSGSAALVTGGASGIGAAIAAGLAKEGCDIAIVDRVVDGGVAALQLRVEAAGRRLRAIEADVRDFGAAEEAVQFAKAEFGRLDILVANAGITADAPSWKMTEEQWDAVLDVNLKGCFAYARAAAALFREQQRGRMVFVASINGIRGKFAQANYAASKGGMIALAKTMARELGKYGVNVNVVAPGMVRTPLVEGLPAAVLQRATDETVLGRIAAPEDIADTVVFLCSVRARHLTGAVVQVDGGQHI
jgi:3-oxoacyl-[acyl-carrier protein] reductase